MKFQNGKNRGMKYSRIYLLACLISLVNLCGGQESSLLWKVSENGLAKPSYLFGTIHMICQDQIRLAEKVERAFAKCEQLTLELDLDEADFMSRMQQQSLNPNMVNISGKMNEREKSLVNAYFQEHYGTDLSQLGILKPFVLISMMYAKAIECDTAGSIESTLLKKARSKGWEIHGLEKIEDQISLFDSVSVEEQLSWMVKYIEDEQHFKALMRQITKAYLKEDLNQIARMNDEFPEYADMEEVMLGERNRKWIDTIVKQAEKKPTFFAVGAAHLGSKSGLIKLLKQEGYQVEAVF